MTLCRTITFLKEMTLRKGGTLILAFFWITGLLCGMLSCYLGDYTIFSVMRRSVYSSVSIVWYAVVSIIPFLFSALAVFLSSPWLLLTVCFLKALSFGFMLCGLNWVMGGAGWLICFAVLSDDFFLVPLLYLFSMRHISGEGKCLFREFVLVLICGLLVVLGTIRWIMPFFAKIIIL